MAWIEDRLSGPRVAWRLKNRNHPLHGKRQHFECGDDDAAEKVLAIVEDHDGSLTQEEVEAIILGPEQEAPSTAPTFGAWSAEVLENRTRISPRTRADYREILAYRILPGPDEIDPPTRYVAGWRERAMNSFLPHDITRYINGLRADGLATGTIDKHFALLSSIFSAAVKNKAIPENPCAGTDYVRNQTDHDDTGEEEHVYLTPDEWSILHSHCPEPYQDFVEALLTTAGRFGEVTALQPRDLIHPTARDPLPRLQIRRAWKRNEEGEYYLGTTKGRQRRQSAIDNDLFQMLLGLAADKAPDDLLFTAPRGGRIEYQNFLNRVWNPTIIAARRCAAHPPPSQASPLPERVGVCGDYGGIGNKTGKPCQKELARGLDRCAWHTGPIPTAISECDCSSILHRRPSIHDLRHTCTAWLFADPTVGPLYVSRYLGHASMEVTDKVYAGLVPHGEGAAVIAIAKARGKVPQTPKTPAPPRKKTRINAARAESSNLMRRGRRSAA